MPERVAVGSLFRNSSRTLGYYRALLENQIGDGFELVFSFVEGDSSDDTWQRLQAWASEDSRVRLKKCDVEPVSDFQDRVRKWAELGNEVIENLDGVEYDWFLWCESDLCIPPDLILQLLAARKDIVAPVIFLGDLFYDTWGFRGQDGQRYRNTAPYHPAHRSFATTPIQSAGSVLLIRKSVLDKGIRFRGVYDNGLLVGICKDARDLGFEVHVDSSTCVIHPTSLWKAQQYQLGRIEVEIEDHHPFEAVWRQAVAALQSCQHPLLSTPDLAADHPALGDLRNVLSSHLGSRRFSIRSKLHSESNKRYALILTDLESRSSPCPT